MARADDAGGRHPSYAGRRRSGGAGRVLATQTPGRCSCSAQSVPKSPTARMTGAPDGDRWKASRCGCPRVEGPGRRGRALRRMPLLRTCYDSGAGRCRSEGATARDGDRAAPARPGRYRLERRLGPRRDGAPSTWRSTPRSIDASRSSSFGRISPAGRKRRDRFQREARVAAAFSHPNVVTVHDFGVAGGQAFLVMELLDGRTLRERAAQRRAGERPTRSPFCATSRQLSKPHICGSSCIGI